VHFGRSYRTEVVVKERKWLKTRYVLKSTDPIGTKITRCGVQPKANFLQKKNIEIGELKKNYSVMIISGVHLILSSK
jgi:hypothetical protein